MNSRFERMFVAVLSRHATYAEKQLIKTGELGKCVASIIKRRRRSLLLFYGTFFLALMIPVADGLADRVFSNHSEISPNMIFMSCVVAFTGLSNIISTQSSLSRLETLASIWMVSSAEDSSQTMTDADAELSRLIGCDL